MGFIRNEKLRKWEFKHFGVSHSLNEPAPNHVETQVHHPGINKSVTKYIEKYEAVEGLVIDAEWYDRKDDAGQRYLGYVLTVDVGDEVIHLDFPYKKSAAAFRVLTHHGPNVDWSKPVKFSAWKTVTDKGKDATAVCFWQKDNDGNEFTVKSAHTKDNPNGCPPPEETMDGLSWAKAERWLKAQFDAVCVPAIKAAGKGHVVQVQPQAMSASAAAFAAQSPSARGAEEYDGGDDTMPADLPNSDDVPF